MNLLLEDDGVKLKQREKHKWLNEGDRNTRFYHQFASQRKKINVIQMVIDESGKVAVTIEEISIVFQGVFQDIFTSSKPNGIVECLSFWN